MRLLSALISASIVILVIISTTFAYLALKSPNWSSQAYYFVNSPGGTNVFSDASESNRLYVAVRSPFYKCGIPAIYSNKTIDEPLCQFYKPYGFQQTSCQTVQELSIPYTSNGLVNGLLGGAQECQAVHFAGNLQIATCVFVTLGLVTSLGSLALSLLTPGHHQHESTTTNSVAAEEKSHHHSDGIESSPPPVLAALLDVTRLFLLVGIGLQILAQFFGIIGLVLTASPTPDLANAEQNNPDGTYFVAEQWIVDRGLSRFATVAWTTALAAVLLSGLMRGQAQKVKRL